MTDSGQLTPEQMRAKCSAVIESLVNNETKIRQIVVATWTEDGGTRTQFVGDLAGHSLMIGQLQAQYLDRMRKEMKL